MPDGSGLYPHISDSTPLTLAAGAPKSNGHAALCSLPRLPPLTGMVASACPEPFQALGRMEGPRWRSTSTAPAAYRCAPTLFRQQHGTPGLVPLRQPDSPSEGPAMDARAAGRPRRCAPCGRPRMTQKSHSVDPQHGAPRLAAVTPPPGQRAGRRQMEQLHAGAPSSKPELLPGHDLKAADVATLGTRDVHRVTTYSHERYLRTLPRDSGVRQGPEVTNDPAPAYAGRAACRRRIARSAPAERLPVKGGRRPPRSGAKRP